jgi:hypothetical protein
VDPPSAPDSETSVHDRLWVQLNLGLFITVQQRRQNGSALALALPASISFFSGLISFVAVEYWDCTRKLLGVRLSHLICRPTLGNKRGTSNLVDHVSTRALDMFPLEAVSPQ